MQYFIFNPVFNHKTKSVSFTSGFRLNFMNKYDIPIELWNYNMKGERISLIGNPPLRPTKYESYEFIDLGDDDQWDFCMGSSWI